MSSIHYPALSSVAPVPVQPGRQQSPALPRDGRRSGSTPRSRDGRRSGSTPRSRDGRRSGSTPRSRDSQPQASRRSQSQARPGDSGVQPTTLPPLPTHPRHGDVSSVASSPRRRHSMTQVVARMRVREKTLLELFEGREPSPVSGEGVGVLPPVPAICVADTDTHPGVEFPGRQETGRRPRGRRTSGAGEVPQAWRTPRDAPIHPQDLGPALDPGSAGLLLAAGQQDVASDGTFREAEATQGEDCCLQQDVASDGAFREAEATQGEDCCLQQDIASDGAFREAEATQGEDCCLQETGGDGGSDDSDEEEFDFDEGEEEVWAQREQQQKCGATWSVYQRACRVLRVQPSPAFLRQCPLAVMDLRDVRLGPADVKPIAIALVRDGRVCVLDLSNNDLGPVGVSYVAEMLQENSTLTELNLSATRPGREGIKALCETLRHNKTLAVLRLQENGIEHTEAPLLAALIRSVPTLQGLFLGHNRLGYCGGAAIASALADNVSLRTLDLQWNHIRRDSGVCLVTALQRNKSLRSLNLAWNGLGKEGCLALAHALPRNGSLRELDVTCNRVDVTALHFLLTGVTRNTSLHTLRIGQNPLTTEGAKAIIRAVSSSPRVSLSHIDIGGVPVDTEFTRLLREARQSRDLEVRHEEALTLATCQRKREHEGSNLDRYDPVMALFEYMRLDNLRVIDMFQFMDVAKRDKLSKANIRDGLSTLKLPVTEHSIAIMFDKLDINRDGYVELDEMMKVQRDTARQVKLRQIKARAKGKEDGGLAGLHQTLRDVIARRKEDKEARRDISNNNVSSTKTSGGGRKASVGGLQLTQARYSVTSSKRRGEKPLTSVADEEL